MFKKNFNHFKNFLFIILTLKKLLLVFCINHFIQIVWYLVYDFIIIINGERGSSNYHENVLTRALF